jgi:hypothetical protein
MGAGGPSPRAIVARRALIAAILFYGLLILLLVFPRIEALADLSATLMLPGERVVYDWGSATTHSTWGFILANVLNFLFYYIVFLVIFRALRARGRHPSGQTSPD